MGYGDISPSTTALRTFTVFYILIGCGYVFAQLANVFAGVLTAFANWAKRLIKMLYPTAEMVDTTGDSIEVSHVAGRSDGMSGKARDLTGDGNTDFIDPPMALVFWAQELLPAMLLLMRVTGFHTQRCGLVDHTRTLPAAPSCKAPGLSCRLRNTGWDRQA